MKSLIKNGALGQFENETDVGTVTPAGACVYDAAHQMYTITSAGANIWGDRDDFHFVWKTDAW